MDASSYLTRPSEVATGFAAGPLETDGIVLVHGAFQDEDEYVFTPAQALDGLLDSSAR